MLIAPPNPSVGAVIVRDGLEIARGFTQRPGHEHAEIMAVKAAREKGISLEGATLYVTLEPCSHYGRTPPCALTVIAEKIARVVIGAADPNPLVAGRGVRMLQKAGIEVVSGVCEEEACESNIGFLTRMSLGRPWVRMKVATSLDGRTALTNGVSQWITGSEARADGRRLRACAQGLLTGIGTVLADDPQMNVRIDGLPSPHKYVLDAMARTPVSAKILTGEPCTIFVSDSAPQDNIQALQQAGACVKTIASTESGRLDLPTVLSEIARDEVNVLHVEAGACLNGALLTAGLVDEVVAYVAPCWLGDGLPAAQLPLLTALGTEPRAKFRTVKTLGEDLRLTIRLK